METRILIPNGLKVIATQVNFENSSRKRRKSPRLQVGTVESEEETEEKPSSSSGHFETSDQDRESDKEKQSFRDGRNHDNIYSSCSSSSEENNFTEDEDKEEDKTDLIGSSETSHLEERGRKRGKSVEDQIQRRRRKKQRSNMSQSQSGLWKGHQSTRIQVKICATKVIEKGTIFSANDGDVQVLHLTGIPALPKDDIRFLFGCFESISPVPPKALSSPPLDEIPSSATTTTSNSRSPAPAEGKLVRLCNWIRFLPNKSIETNSSESSEVSQLHDNLINDSEENDNESVVNYSSSSPCASSRTVVEDFTGVRKLNSNNLRARFLDGRPIFEVLSRLVPGTEVVAYFDMGSVITQASSISPFAAMMMISNMQMGLMPPPPQQQQQLQQAPSRENISSSTTPSSSSSSLSSSSTLISSSSSSASSCTLATVGLNKNDFVTLKSMKNERDEKGEREQQQSQQLYEERLLQFYQNVFPIPTPPHNIHQQFPHNPFGIQGYGNWLRNAVLERGNTGKDETKLKEEKDREEKSSQNKILDENDFKTKTGVSGVETPLDLSKLSSSTTTTPSPGADYTAEPLKIGTPFDSPDSNEEDILRSDVKKTYEPPLGLVSGSASNFSIRNVLSKQCSSKLFQPYSLEETSISGIGGNGSSRFQTSSSLATPPSRSDSPVSVVIRAAPPPNIRPILRTRGRERSLLPCEVCGKCFDRPSLLKRHLRTHTGEKPHICDVCSKGFSTSSSLNTHRRIHSGEKPHQCPICGKRFTASSNLYYHRMTHNKEKPHKCMLCGKSFPTPGDLKSHQYVHSGSWPYTCPVCHRGFSKQTNLRNHLLLHSGIAGGPNTGSKIAEKSHTCRICDKKFSQAYNLRAHIRSHEESAEQKPAGHHNNATSTSGMIFGRCNQDPQSSSPTLLQFSPKINQTSTTPATAQVPIAPKAHAIFDQSPLLHHQHHRTISGDPNPNSPGSILSLQQSLPPNLSASSTTFQLGNLGFPPMSSFPLGLGASQLAPPSSNGLPFSITQSTQSAAAAAVTASLFRTSGSSSSTGGGVPTQIQIQSTPPNTNTILEQILEWNYRMAKESVGNLSLNLVQQKLLESQVLAAQFMNQHTIQHHQHQPPQSSIEGIIPVPANFQEYFKMRVGHALGPGTGLTMPAIPRLDGPSEKFGQR